MQSAQTGEEQRYARVHDLELTDQLMFSRQVTSKGVPSPVAYPALHLYVSVVPAGELLLTVPSNSAKGMLGGRPQ